ncbi:MAG: rhomboid family intramembrane serine protease [Planctomycetaceae bacterium]
MSERDYFRHDFEGRGVSPFWASHRATKSLLLLLLGMTVLLLLVRSVSRPAHVALTRALALDPYAVLERLKLWQLVTGALLHGDLLHLLFNALGLWFFGRTVEDRLGPRRMLLVSLGATLSASLAYVAWSLARETVTPMLGFSGAILGILVLVAVWHPNTPVLLFFVIPMRLWVLVAVLIGVDVLMALQVDSDVAHTAHLGGALFGWIYARHGGWFARLGSLVARGAARAPRARARPRDREEIDVRGEVDRILDKVNREGLGSLSDRERQFLKDAGSRLRP